MTDGQPSRDDFYIPPVTAGIPPPPKDVDSSFWFILAVLIIAAFFIVPAIIAAFVFGMAGNINHNKVVAATVNQPDLKTIVATYQGGQDAGQLVTLTVTVTDSKGQAQGKTLGSDTGNSPPAVGEQVSFTGAFSGRDHVVATAHFTDGPDQVILDTVL